jgi:RNA polymerase sigma-70 factor, ECF subfamily
VFRGMDALRDHIVAFPPGRSLDELADEELISQHLLAPGSERSRRSVDELMRRHYGRVVGWCYRLTRNRDLAADLAQDVFVKAYSSLDTFRRDSKFTTWLYVIARNRCRDEQRARAVRGSAMPAEAASETAAEGTYDRNEGLAAIAARDARTVVRSLMTEALQDVESAVMTLHYGYEMPLDAITAALGLTNASGAKAYIVSAKRKLKAAVKRWNLKS